MWDHATYHSTFFGISEQITRFDWRCFQIDEESPFFEMTPQSLLSSQFEIVVVMEGVTEETGNTVQGRQTDDRRNLKKQ